MESTTVTTAQRIQIRKLFQKVGLTAKQGEELDHVPQFLQKLIDIADRAGGEAPKPERPNTSSIDEIRLTAGNEQLLLLFNRRDELTQLINAWTNLGERIDKRWPSCNTLKRLAGHVNGIKDADVILSQIKTIEQQRQLLEEPDPVAPLVANLTQLLRDELNRAKAEWDQTWTTGEEKLKNDENWQKLEPEQKHDLRLPHGLMDLCGSNSPPLAAQRINIFLFDTPLLAAG